MRLKVMASMVAVLAVMQGCAAREPDPGERVESRLERITTPVAPSTLQTTVRGLNDFTLSLHRRVAKADENFVSAPISITGALAMTSAGVAGQTLDGFRQTLRITGSQADFHHAVNTLDLALLSRGQGAQGVGSKPFTFVRVNQLFAQKDYPIEVPFLDTLAQHYGAGLRLLDFAGAPEPSRTAINAFVGFHTEQLISELLPRGVITVDTRVVLANAVYFNAAWQTKFDERATAKAAFTTGDGRTVQVDTMNAELTVRAATVGSVEAVELPYEKDEVALLALMPAQGDLASFEASLDAAKLEAYTQALSREALIFSMPKLDLRSPTNLSEALRAEGLAVAFDDRADFTPLSARAKADGLHITDVVHQAVIKVSEGGTEASGATAVIIGTDSAAFGRRLELNRPFVFVLRDRATGAVLFLGHVVDPS